MASDERWQKGIEKFNEVYCGDVPAPPRGASDFFDLMIENLFGEVWTRPGLTQRDRRLLLLGAIAAQGEPTTFAIQVKAAIKNAELEPDQVREVLIHLTQYVGYPKVASLLGVTEQTIAAVAKEQQG